MDAVIFDMDGTLADVAPMRHYVSDPNHKNFDAFHKSACLFARPIVPVRKAASTAYYQNNEAVLIVTARKRMWGDLTKQWLDNWAIPYTRIYMRANGDDRRDYEVKRDILARIRSQGFHVKWAWDDNPNVVQLWLEEGIPVTWVPGWEWE